MFNFFARSAKLHHELQLVKRDNKEMEILLQDREVVFLKQRAIDQAEAEKKLKQAIAETERKTTQAVTQKLELRHLEALSELTSRCEAEESLAKRWETYCLASFNSLHRSIIQAWDLAVPYEGPYTSRTVARDQVTRLLSLAFERTKETHNRLTEEKVRLEEKLHTSIKDSFEILRVSTNEKEYTVENLLFLLRSVAQERDTLRKKVAEGEEQLAILRRRNAFQFEADPSAEKCIYVLSNPCFPGSLKIGKTGSSVQERVRQYQTGAPSPFKIELTWNCEKYSALERDLHRTFNEYRVNKNREFFLMDIELIKQYIIEHANQYN